MISETWGVVAEIFSLEGADVLISVFLPRDALYAKRGIAIACRLSVCL